MLNTTCRIKHINTLINRIAVRFIRVFYLFKCQKSVFISQTTPIVNSFFQFYAKIDKFTFNSYPHS